MRDEIEEKLFEFIHGGDVDAARKVISEHPSYLQNGYRSYEGWLKIAVEGGHRPMVEALLKMGCDVNEGRKTSAFETPLWAALGKDDLSMVRFLLDQGADATRGRFVIDAITGMNEHSLEMVKLLEQHGADIHRVFLNELSNEPMNALSTAIDWGKDDVAEYLGSKGAILPPGIGSG